MEPSSKVKHMKFVDGRCSCCPYGYHIDLDFMHFIDGNDSLYTLHDLKKVHRDKKKLRKSMEMFLRQQELAALNEGSTVRNYTDIPSSYTQNVIETLDKDEYTKKEIFESSKEKISDAFDDSEDFVVEDMTENANKNLYSADDEKHNRLDQDLQSRLFLANSNSVSSLCSTISCEQFSPNDSIGQSHSFVTSAQLANNMETLFSDSGADSSSLQAIRQQMAVSLQRMFELEQQIKAIPVLQVRISVLKEEKRLLMLQLKSKYSKLNKQDVGIGEGQIDHPNYGIHEVNCGGVEKLKPSMRSSGVNEYHVWDNATQKGYREQSNVNFQKDELHTEANTFIHEKEIKTVFLGPETFGQELTLKSQVTPKSNPSTFLKAFRTIGVGDADIYDIDNIQFHQKEFRTVFIGDKGTDRLSHRNVGVLCKVPTRDVGVTYMFEEDQPVTRNIGIGVGEVGIDRYVTNENDVDNEGWSSNISTTVHNTMQQMNMAAFHTKHIHIKNEALRKIIDEKLKKNVNSKAIQCKFPTDNKSILVKCIEPRVSIGCGDDTIDVKVEELKHMRSIAVETKLTVTNRSTITDRMCTNDVGTTTHINIDASSNKSTNTEPLAVYPAATNTDRLIHFNACTETEVRVFKELGILNSTGVNTSTVSVIDCASNTKFKTQLEDKNFDFNISFCNEGIQTDTSAKYTRDRGTHTNEIRKFEKGINTLNMPLYTKSIGTGWDQTECLYSNNKESGNIHNVLYQSHKRDTGVKPKLENQNRNIATVEEKSGKYQYLSSEANNGIEIVQCDTDESMPNHPTTNLDTSDMIEYMLGSSKSQATHTRSSEDYVFHTSSITSKPTGIVGINNFSRTENELEMITNGGQLCYKNSQEPSVQLKTERRHSGQEIKYVLEDDGKGGTKMKVIQNVETTYVGSTPVCRNSNAILIKPHAFSDTLKSAEGINKEHENFQFDSITYCNNSPAEHVQQLEVNSLRSIMKLPKESMEIHHPCDQIKKEITFSAHVGGDLSNSDVSEEETVNKCDSICTEGELGKGESDRESDAEESFDEGSYDGRHGNIIFTCKDNESIESGIPGASMFEQNILGMFQLSTDMKNSCEIYAKFLEDSTKVNSKQLNSSLNIIHQEWFKCSSHKVSCSSQVKDCMTYFNRISKHLLVNVVNMADSNGNTALHYAVSHCNMEIVNLLLDTKLCEINKQNKAGYTAVMLASLTQIQLEKDRNVVRRLYDMGDMNAQASQTGQTALMLAVSHGRSDMVKMLLASGACVNVQDEDGSTALMCASEHGHTEIVQMLLAHPECDPTLTDNDGSSALSIAMDASHRDIGVLLYAHVNFKQNSPEMKVLPKPLTQNDM